MKLLIIFLTIWLFSFDFYGQVIGLYESKIEQSRAIYLKKITESNEVLDSLEKKNFKGLAYFDVDTNYLVKGLFKKDVGPIFELATSKGYPKKYQRIGIFSGSIHKDSFQLEVYQSIFLKGRPGFENYLFIPFKDETNGEDTYSAGRYIELNQKIRRRGKKSIPMELDFNNCYNPYCVYSDKFSCPIPPDVNKMKISIFAGEKYVPSHE